MRPSQLSGDESPYRFQKPLRFPPGGLLSFYVFSRPSNLASRARIPPLPTGHHASNRVGCQTGMGPVRGIVIGWEARTNTGKMQNGAIFLVLQSPQIDNQVATNPSSGTPISVHLTLNEPAIPGTVVLATPNDMSLDIKDNTLWHLEPWRNLTGMEPPAPHGMAGIYWQVTL